MGLIDTVREELPVIKQAPWTITGSVLVLSLTAGGLIYAGFKESLSRKDDLITTLKAQLDAAKKQVPVAHAEDPLPASAPPVEKKVEITPNRTLTTPPKSRTDRSVKIGDKNQFTNSPVVTGDKNTVNINDDWNLTEPQRQDLRAAMAAFSASVAIWEVSNDRHSHSFSQTIGAVLSGIPGWTAEWGGGEALVPFPGVVIEVGHADFPAAAELQKQLRGMGIPADGSLSVNLPPNQMILHIGTKPH